MSEEKTNIPAELKDEALDAVSGGGDSRRDRGRHHPDPWFTPEEMWAQGYIVIGDPKKYIWEYNNHSLYGDPVYPTMCPFCGHSDSWEDHGRDRYYCRSCRKNFYYYHH